MSDQNQPTETLVYNGGAARSGRLPQYRLIPRSFLWHTAEAFSEGNVKYEQIQEIGRQTPLTSNWRKGDLTFFLDAFNHLINHAADASNRTLELGLTLQGPEPQEGFVYNEVRRTLEDLGHAAANIAFLIEWLDSGAAVEMMAREVLQVREIHRSLAERRQAEDAERVTRAKEAYQQAVAGQTDAPALSPLQEIQYYGQRALSEEELRERALQDASRAVHILPEGLGNTYPSSLEVSLPAEPEEPLAKKWLKTKVAEAKARFRG